MGRLQIVLSDDLDKKLRQRALKKGDISGIVEQALRKFLEEQ